MALNARKNEETENVLVGGLPTVIIETRGFLCRVKCQRDVSPVSLNYHGDFTQISARISAEVAEEMENPR